MRPVDTSGRAINAYGEVVLFSRRDLAHRQRAVRAVVEAQKGRRLIVEPPLRYRNTEVGAQLGDMHAGDVFGEVECVHADVADAASGPGSLRIRAPLRLAITLGLDLCGEPPL